MKDAQPFSARYRILTRIAPVFSRVSEKRKKQYGFTLTEILLVIGILAILVTAILYLLNPGEIMKQTRDNTRLRELDTLQSSLTFAILQNPDVFLGTSKTVYISVADPLLSGNATSTCPNMGLPPLPSGFSYQCVSSANLRKTDGSGWLPVNTTSSNSSLTQLPVDPLNLSDKGYYYRYIASNSFHLEALLESGKKLSLAVKDGGASPIAIEKGTNLSLLPGIFPAGFVRVPGNPAFGTSDFYVMQYEAKYDKNGDGVGDNSADYSCIADTGDGWDSRDPGCSSGGQGVVSSPDGSPIVHVNHQQALALCAARGLHLLTNDEYMTIARDLEQVDANWSGGKSGNGYIYNGNSGNTTMGYNAPTDPDKGTGRNSRAKLTLSNGLDIYDFAGNVYEQVQRSTNNAGDATNAMDLPPCSDGVAAWGSCSYNSAGAPYVSSWTTDIVRNLTGPSNSAWTSSNGIGSVTTYKNGADQGTTVFLRGGCWDTGSEAGIFGLVLSWTATTQGDCAGFRCALNGN